MKMASIVEQNATQRSAFPRIKERSASIVAQGFVLATRRNPTRPTLTLARSTAPARSRGKRASSLREISEHDHAQTQALSQALTHPHTHAPGTYDTGASVPSGRPIQYQSKRNAVQTMPKTSEYGSMSVIKLPRPAFFEYRCSATRMMSK